MFSISKLIRDLEYKGITYTIGGSGLLKSLGFPVQMSDWDFFIDVEKTEVLDALKNWDIIEKPSDEHSFFKSKYLLELKNDEGKPIEIIGYFTIKAGDALIPLPAVVHHRWENMKIAHPLVWFIAYSLMGRKQKADLLKQYLNVNPTDKEWIDYYVRQSIPKDIQEVLLQFPTKKQQ
ncbi:hypothetical protein GCM10008967_05620 [Bacillus carboniphilus]|uniref:Nucleotidyltransferase family protein n=1 Tax=Bacillus carboniphilus TaxID=86663 RepID=A0ABN0VV63_9BACI